MTATADTTATPTGRGGDTPPLLRMTDVDAGYHGIPVIRKLNLEVNPGEVVALVGANGAGKTTTLSAVGGIIKPQSGVVELIGSTDKAPLHRRAHRGLSFVTEQRSIISGLSTEDNLRLGRGSVDLALKYVPELERLLKRRAGLLSGGEQQMLTLARALASQPKVLLADEMSLGLAPIIVQRLLSIIREAADETGLAALVVEQQVRNVLAVADYAYVLRRGRLVMEGAADDLRGRMTEVEAHYLAASELD